MNVLIVTQAVDTEDPVLGFFARWIEEFAKHTERIEVICLKEGKHALPANVRVYSLGKERSAASRAAYAIRFLSLAWKLRRGYETVFVHMNQEYIFIAGWLWKLLGKRIYLWRNHYAGSLLTDAAAAFCTKVFCTSHYSYTAKYKKTVLMPVGVDTGRFKPDERIVRKPHSILFLARMTPAKHPETLIDALVAFSRADYTATFVGSPLPKDEAYYEGLQKSVRSLSLADQVSFSSAVPNSKTPGLYRANEIFVNTSPSGMLDKTIFEAAACGCFPLTSNRNLTGHIDGRLLFEEGSAEDLARKLSALFLLDETDKRTLREGLHLFVERTHSLRLLGEKLAHALI